MSTSFYSEEKTLAAPDTQQNNQQQPASVGKKSYGLAGTEKAGEKLYGRELNQYDDKDIEKLLSNLSTDELTELNNDFDPDNSFLPPSQRCRDQTEKKPTGPYQREKLLDYLEDKAKNEKDWEEVVPFCPGFKRGKVYEINDEDKKSGGNSEDVGKGGMQMPIELDIDDDDETVEKALDTAPERDLVDLAGILGMHNVLNQPQYYNALKGKGQSEETGTTFTGGTFYHFSIYY